MTIPDEAVQAAIDVYENPSNNCLTYNNMHAAPFLQGVKVDGARIEAARNAVEELANTHMCLTLEDWSRISSTILSAIELAPSPRAQALEALFDAVTLMQKHDEKFEGEIPLTTIQKVYAAHTTASRTLSSQPVADTRPTGGSNHGE